MGTFNFITLSPSDIHQENNEQQQSGHGPHLRRGSRHSSSSFSSSLCAAEPHGEESKLRSESLGNCAQKKTRTISVAPGCCCAAVEKETPSAKIQKRLLQRIYPAVFVAVMQNKLCQFVEQEAGASPSVRRKDVALKSVPVPFSLESFTWFVLCRCGSMSWWQIHAQV